jgi:hypothetical protein
MSQGILGQCLTRRAITVNEPRENSDPTPALSHA